MQLPRLSNITCNMHILKICATEFLFSYEEFVACRNIRLNEVYVPKDVNWIKPIQKHIKEFSKGYKEVSVNYQHIGQQWLSVCRQLKA